MEASVLSVIQQPHSGIGIILVNDGSTDHSPQICNQLAQKYQNIAVIHQDNQGVSAARNAGLAYALEHICEDEQTYIAFLDADDLWRSNAVTPQLIDSISTHRWDIVGFSCYYSNQSATSLAIHNQYAPLEIIREHCGMTDWILNGTFCAHFYSSTILKQNALRFNPDVKHNEDVIFMRQAVFCSKRIKLCPDFLHVYRMNPTSATHTSFCNLNTATHIASAWHDAASWADAIDAPYKCSETWRNTCLSVSASRLLEAARALAEQGYSHTAIENTLRTAPFYENIQRLTPEEMAKWQASDLILYRRDPKKFYKRHQLRGFFAKLASLLLMSRTIRKWKDSLRFRIPADFGQILLPVTESVIHNDKDPVSDP